MPFIPTPDGVETTIKALQNGVPIVNVFHTRESGTIDIVLLTDVADTFKDWVDNYMLDMMDSSYIVQSITSKDISVANGVEVTINYTTGGNGTAGNTPAAANAAIVASWRTAQTGRSFRGRTYFGGMEQTNLATAQTISTGAATAYASMATALLTLLDSAGHTLCVLSKVALGVARVAGVLTEIISLVIDTKVDSQRNRTAN